MKRIAALAPVFVVVQLSLLTGCGAILTQGYYEWKGAYADLKQNEPVADDALAAYKSFEFAPCTTPVSTRIVPTSVRTAYDANVQTLIPMLAELYPGGTPKLRLETELWYYQEKGVFSGALCLARIRGRDGERVVVDAIVKGESQSFRKMEPADIAQGMARAVGEVLAKQKGGDFKKLEKAYREKEKAEEKERRQREKDVGEQVKQ